MNNTINISKPTIMLFQRIIALTSTILSFAVLFLWFFGAIPFKSQQTDIFNVINMAFDIFEIGRKTFINIACSVLFVIMYFIKFFKSLIPTLESIKYSKKCTLSKLDSPVSRLNMSKCVNALNISVYNFFVLLLISKFIFPYTLEPKMLITIIGIFTLTLAINILHSVYLTKNAVESILMPVSRVLILACTFVYGFVTDFDIVSVWKAFGSFFSLFSFSNLGFTVILNTLIQTIVIPIIYIFFAFALTMRSKEAFLYNDGITANSKSTLIKAVICLGIILVATGFICEYKTVEQYSPVLLNNLQLILIPISIFIASFTMKLATETRDFFDPLATESSTQETMSSSGSTDNSEIS